MSLVSCAFVGQALINWLENATVDQRQAICEALACGPTDDQITKAFMDCEGQVHIPGAAVPTCEQMNDAIAEALVLVLANSNSISFSGAGTTASPKRANVVVSPDAGNRLEIRESGVGVFDTPPADVSFQYVSSTGDDAAAGTQAAPLKTLDRALRRIIMSKTMGTYSIFLHAGETFELTAESYGFTGKDIAIYVFNDPIYGTSLPGACSYYFPAIAAELTRAKIKNNWIARPDIGEARVTRVYAKSISLNGIEVEFTANDTQYPMIGAQTVLGGAEALHLNGVKVDRYQAGCRFSAPRINTMVLELNSHGHYAGTSWSNDLGVTWTKWSPGDRPACLGRPAFTARESNLETLPVTFLVNSLAYDANTKSLFGATCNWDPFA